MRQRDPLIPLRHMLDHAREALALTQGKSETEVLADRVLCLALIRLLEVLGEAANRVPVPERLQHPGIPWRQIVSLRNRLIHGYDSVNMQILWQIIVADLPPLVTALEAALPPTGTLDSSAAN